VIMFTITLRPIGLLSVGWSHPLALGPDIPFTRIPHAVEGAGGIRPEHRLGIPGSSLKGSLRAAAGKVASAYGFTSCGRVNPELMEKIHGKRGTCDVCDLFGKPKSNVPSPLFVGNLEPAKSPITLTITRIRVDDSSLKVAKGALFTSEHCLSNIEFRGLIRIMGSVRRELLGLLLLSFAELRLGRFGKHSLVDIKLENTDQLRGILEPRWIPLLDRLERWLWT